MKTIKKSIYALVLVALFAVAGCSPKLDYCDQPEVQQTLKNALISNLEGWQQNAKYAGIEDFEKKVSEVVEDLEITDTWYAGGNDYRSSEVYLDRNAPGVGSCRCSSQIRFKDHKKYKQSIEGPVSKVKAEEHPLNSAYLRLEEKMNYLDNDGFEFSYVVIKEDVKPIQIIKFYPLVKEPNIGDAGKLIYKYVESLDK